MLSEFQNGLVAAYDRLLTQSDLGPDGRPANGFCNLGYFAPGIDDISAARERLMDVLLERIEHRDGLALDVGCGIGGTARCLTKLFPATSVYGINISPRQIEQCRERVPGGQFQVMPAERMTFRDAMFTTVISVEAAMHFKGRREFLLEAMRVLKPGGEIVITDMPFWAEPTVLNKFFSGQEIYADIEAYRTLWESCGVSEVKIEDVTKFVWHDFCQNMRNTAFHDHLSGLIDGPTLQNRLKMASKIRNLPALAYVIVKGRKL